MGSLSQAERALIDAAVAAGRVQVIPAGASAFATPRWNGHQLVYPALHDSGSPVSRAVAERREKIQKLHGQGLSVLEIAALLLISDWTVRHDHHALGLAFNSPSPTAMKAEAANRWKADPANAARREKVAPMRCKGMTKRAIAEALGVPQSVVENDVKVLRREGRIPDGIDPQGKTTRRRNAA